MNIRYMLEVDGSHVGTFTTEANCVRHARDCYTLRRRQLVMYVYDGSILQSVYDLTEELFD
jgi:hypothetical protein